MNEKPEIGLLKLKLQLFAGSVIWMSMFLIVISCMYALAVWNVTIGFIVNFIIATIFGDKITSYPIKALSMLKDIISLSL